MSAYTIKDIARMVGVSTGTVSRVLNNAENINPEIYRRTMDVVRSVNYHPGTRGRRQIIRPPYSMDRKPGKTWNIGIIYCGSSESFSGSQFVNLSMRQIEKTCRRQGYNAVVEFISEHDNDMPRLVSSRKVDGILCTNLASFREQLIPIASIMPITGLFFYMPNSPVPQVCQDDYSIGTMVMQEVFNRGHRRIAFINFMLSHQGFHDRERAYRDFMEEHGLSYPEYLLRSGVVNTDNPCHETPPDMDVFVEEIMEMKALPTAIVVANDWGAAGLYRSLRKAGLEPGRDISVIGFDNFIESAGFLDPGLATVAIPFDRIAEMAVQQLIEWVETGKCDICVKMLPGIFLAKPSLAEISGGDV